MTTRREFIKLGGAAAAGAYIASRTRFLRSAFAAQSTQVPLAASAIPQFIVPLPNLHLITDKAQIELQMTEFMTQVLPPPFGPTYVWGYLEAGQTAVPSYIGPVIVATRGVPIEIKWLNNLGTIAGTNVKAYKYSTDQTLHWADPLHGEANHQAHMATIPAYQSAGSLNYGEDLANPGSFLPVPIPAVPHLHGGEVPPVLDGGPDAWYLSQAPDLALYPEAWFHGHAFYSKDGAAATNYAIYRYPNTQEAAPIWFHDHTLGATRLGVYAGLAGAYPIVDPQLQLPPGLDPVGLGGELLIPLVIQDRSFDVDGQFLMPADSTGGVLWAPNPDHPYWVPEFVGDTVVVNGVAWPFRNLERKRYRFLFLNGSNARTYEMFLTDPVTKVNGPPMWVIGTDGGYLDAPVKIDPNAPKGQLQRLVMMPGERYDVIVDFNDPQWLALNPNFSGSLLLRNIAKTPFPAGATPQGGTVGRIMLFRVGAPPAGGDPGYNPAGNIPLRPPMVRLVAPATGTVPANVTVRKVRQLTLNEVMGMPQTAVDPVTGALTNYPGGPLEILVNNTKWNGQRIIGVDADQTYIMEPIPGFEPDGAGNYLSEVPVEGETEVWEIINITADAHPIHLHLVQFQLLNRQNIDAKKYTAAYAAAFSGGGYDHMTMQPYPAGVFIPGWGPPDVYNPALPAIHPLFNAPIVGGNPDVTLFVKGPVQPPAANEAGWKDTVIVYPGQVTRLVVRWAPTDIPAGTPPHQASFPFDPTGGHGYVWHCHIIDHEDNEMMRPDRVAPNPAATPQRAYVEGVDY